MPGGEQNYLSATRAIPASACPSSRMSHVATAPTSTAADGHGVLRSPTGAVVSIPAAMVGETVKIMPALPYLDVTKSSNMARHVPLYIPGILPFFCQTKSSNTQDRFKVNMGAERTSAAYVLT